MEYVQGHGVMMKPLLESEPIPDFLHERSRCKNVWEKPTDECYCELLSTYGENRIIKNGYAQREKIEIYSGVAEARKLGVEFEDCYIYNLPFTVKKANGKAAETAFTDKKLGNIYLVPDYTPIRISNDIAYHSNGFQEYISSLNNGKHSLPKSVKERIDVWSGELQKLTVGQRACASMLHEYGHVLTYRAMDRAGITDLLSMYNWLDEAGYIDNCSQRIVSFTESHPKVQINMALEQLAEDYRLSNSVRSMDYPYVLPHCISYLQDILNPVNYEEGVECMLRLVNSDGRQKAEQERKRLESVLPFGEAHRDSNFMMQFSHGSPTPITKEQKDEMRMLLMSVE